MRAASRQRGVALISVLLVFSLVAILLSGSVTRDGLDIRRSSYHLRYSQVLQYALGGEELARQVLFKDWQEDRDQQTADHQQESWYKLEDFEPGRGRMRVVIRDLQARFNLNNLVNGEGKADARQMAILQRLLRALNLPTEEVPALVDWIDRDTEPTSTRSEDAWFLSREPAYRSADNRLVDTSELRATGLFNEEDLERLLPHVCSLPAFTTINPNTAERAVLSALHAELNADQVISLRESTPFASDSEFLQSDATAGLSLSDTDISVHSDWFEVKIVAQLEDSTVYLRSVLHRAPESGTMTTVMRSLLKPALIEDSALSNANQANQ